MTYWDDLEPGEDYVLNRARLYRDRRDFVIQPGDSGKPRKVRNSVLLGPHFALTVCGRMVGRPAWIWAGPSIEIGNSNRAVPSCQQTLPPCLTD